MGEEGERGGRAFSGDRIAERAHKDLAAGEEDAGERKVRLEKALACYRAGFERAKALADREGAAYCGINAAAMAVLAEDFLSAEELAARTLEQAGEGKDYFALATLAEAALISRDDEAASALYRKASALAEKMGRWGDLASTRSSAGRFWNGNGMDPTSCYAAF